MSFTPIVLVTGASAKGLGAYTALALATSRPPPARIVLLARSASKVQPVIDQIATIAPTTKASFVSISLDDLDSVRTAANDITTLLGTDGKIDILINNAGIMAHPFTLTKQGFESQFGVNHIGHFLLTLRLMPLFKRAGTDARIVNVSSDGYKICPFRPSVISSNYNNGADYDVWSGYGQSKTANILFSKGLAKRGVTSFSLHPGVIMDTSLSEGLDKSAFNDISDITKKNTGKEFVMDKPKSLEQGVATSCVAAVADIAGPSGSFLTDCQPIEVSEYASDEAMVEKLWEMSEQMVGEKFVI